MMTRSIDYRQIENFKGDGHHDDLMMTRSIDDRKIDIEERKGDIWDNGGLIAIEGRAP